jgi:hypothetical protein
MSASPPSEAAIQAVDALRLEGIVEFCDLAASYARSASEAAFRNDRLTLRTHLMQLRACVVEALKTHKELTPLEDEKARAAA